jgi:hypothetical protein
MARKSTRRPNRKPPKHKSSKPRPKPAARKAYATSDN